MPISPRHLGQSRQQQASPVRVHRLLHTMDYTIPAAYFLH